MVTSIDLQGILAAQIADPATSWSLGTFGAIAEFMRDPDELLAAGCTGLAAATARGAIRIQPTEELRLIASESVTRDSWS